MDEELAGLVRTFEAALVELDRLRHRLDRIEKRERRAGSGPARR